MKAVILVGGKATRLEPLTINTPKSMVPVLNKPLLEHLLRHLESYQIKDIILAQGHLSQSIENYFGDGNKLGIRLTYSIEDIPLGSAGAAKYAEKYLNDTFLVINGDIFSDLDFKEMINSHRQRKAKITIAVIPVEDPTSLGLVITDDNHRVNRFLEKPKLSEVGEYSRYLINAGAWLVEPDVLSEIPSYTQFSFERDVFPKLVAEGKAVYAYTLSGYWLDMGTTETYLQLHHDLLRGESANYTPDGNLSAGENTEIHPSTEISGPLVIGRNCSIGQNVKLLGPTVIGDGCVIKEYSQIEGSVIWKNVHLESGVTLKNCILADNCRLGADSGGEGLVLADNVTVKSGSKLGIGSKISPGTTVNG